MAKKATVKKPRNRAAQDVNLINLRALKKRVTALEQQVKEILDRLPMHRVITRSNWPSGEADASLGIRYGSD